MLLKSNASPRSRAGHVRTARGGSGALGLLGLLGQAEQALRLGLPDIAIGHARPGHADQMRSRIIGDRRAELRSSTARSVLMAGRSHQGESSTSELAMIR